MNFADITKFLLGAGKNVTQDTPTGYKVSYQQTDPNIFQRVGSGFNSILSSLNRPAPVAPAVASAPTSIPSPVASPVSAPVSPQPLSAPAFDANTIKSMIAIYGGENPPLSKYADQLAGATKYDFWKNNPELLALIPHLETSSGKNVTRPHNLTNWGINYPGNNALFEKMTEAEVLDRFITGLAERDRNYSAFRTGAPLTDEQLLEFANKYEPANKSYGPNLVEGRAFIRKQLGL